MFLRAAGSAGIVLLVPNPGVTILQGWVGHSCVLSTEGRAALRVGGRKAALGSEQPKSLGRVDRPSDATAGTPASTAAMVSSPGGVARDHGGAAGRYFEYGNRRRGGRSAAERRWCLTERAAPGPAHLRPQREPDRRHRRAG